jgi:hypothetical protein
MLLIALLTLWLVALGGGWMLCVAAARGDRHSAT